jgi:hypothetical protein
MKCETHFPTRRSKKLGLSLGASHFPLECEPFPSQEPQKTDIPSFVLPLLQAPLTSEAMEDLLPRSLLGT